MPRGGARPNSGPKKGTKYASKKEAYDPESPAGEMPLDYMLRIMRDPKAKIGRRDRMAVVALPFTAARGAGVQRLGKKEAAEAAARRAGEGTDWGDDLDSPVPNPKFRPPLPPPGVKSN
jgi:hypothetical protein